MATQHNYTTFNVPTPPISCFFYGTNNKDRVEMKVPAVYNVDSGEVEPNVPLFGSGGPVHKCVVTSAGRDFLCFSWNVVQGQGISRNKSLKRIRQSTLFYGEVLVFPKGIPPDVPFLKNALIVRKRLVEEAVGGYITAVMNARDAGHVPPTHLTLTV